MIVYAIKAYRAGVVCGCTDYFDENSTTTVLADAFREARSICPARPMPYAQR